MNDTKHIHLERIKKIWQEFKDFALKGNVIDLAVGVMIGAAFQSVVTALTANIFSPIIGLLAGQNFDALVWDIPRLGVTIGYGAFLTALVNFFITAFIIFLLVKTMNRLFDSHKKKAPPPAPTTKICPYCLSDVDIRATRCKFCTSELEQPQP